MAASPGSSCLSPALHYRRHGGCIATDDIVRAAGGGDDQPSEVEQSILYRTFKQFDRDGSGTIDVNELRRVMEYLGVSMNERQLTELVEQVDVDETGELEFDEFSRLLSMWKAAAKFKLFDNDSHGGMKSISKERLSKALATTLILPDSWGRCAFDGVVALVACLCLVVVLLQDTGITDPSLAAVVEVIATVTFGADVAVGCLTCYRDGFQWYDTVAESVRHYLRPQGFAVGWMVPDVLAALPLGVIPGPAGDALRHLRLLKIFKIPFMWANSGKMPMTARYIRFHFKQLPITLLVLCFCLMVHVFTIGFMLAKQRTGTDPLLVDGRYPYDAAMSFVMYTLCVVGYGNVVVDGSLEKLYSCLVLLGAMLCNGFVIGQLVSIMQAADIHQDRRGKLRETLAVLEHFKVPHSLQDEVLQFQDHLLGHSLGASYASIVDGLPSEMRLNIDIIVKLRMLSSASMFRELHDIVRIALAQHLGNTVVIPEEQIVAAGEPCLNMFFIAHGVVDMVQIRRDGKNVRRALKAGQNFGGDGVLVEGTVWSVSAKTVGYCDLWTLSRNHLVALSARFIRLRDVLARYEKRPVLDDCERKAGPLTIKTTEVPNEIPPHVPPGESPTAAAERRASNCWPSLSVVDSTRRLSEGARSMSEDGGVGGEDEDRNDEKPPPPVAPASRVSPMAGNRPIRSPTGWEEPSLLGRSQNNTGGDTFDLADQATADTANYGSNIIATTSTVVQPSPPDPAPPVVPLDVTEAAAKMQSIYARLQRCNTRLKNLM